MSMSPLSDAELATLDNTASPGDFARRAAAEIRALREGATKTAAGLDAVDAKLRTLDANNGKLLGLLFALIQRFPPVTAVSTPAVDGDTLAMIGKLVEDTTRASLRLQETQAALVQLAAEHGALKRVLLDRGVVAQKDFES